MALTPQTRSVRNNNPGNLRIGVQWAGLCPREKMTPAQLAETEFCVFISPAWGFRALALDLHTKWQRDGLKTIQAIITKFAPPSENPTTVYIATVSVGMGIAPDTPLNLDDPDQLESLCKAISHVEAGGWFFSTNDLAEGVGMALRPAVNLVS